MTKLLSILTALASVSAGAAHIEFDDVTLFGGTLTYTGNAGAPLVGTDIVFDTVIGVGTPVSGPLQIVGGRLNFITGANLSEGATLDQFSGGGSFVLTGTVIKPDLSVVASGILASGAFGGTSIVLGLGGGNGLFSGTGTDIKNPDLLRYFGIAPGTPFDFAHTDIGFAPAGLEADGGFVATVVDADLTNTPQALPDGGSMIAMIGMGIMGLAVFRRK